MKINRREIMKRAALASGGALVSSSFFPRVLGANENAATKTGNPKRFIFFTTGNGFHPDHVRPTDIEHSNEYLDLDLTKHKLPIWTEALESWKDRTTVVRGLQGWHCQPYHGCPFGFLGGYKSHHKSTTPNGITIDCALSKLQPPMPMPVLGLAFGALETMQQRPVAVCTSAWDNSRPLPLFSDPEMAYQNLFGCAAEGESLQSFLAETQWCDLMLADAQNTQRRLGGRDQEKLATYIKGLEENKKRRQGLMAMRDRLAKYLPEKTERYAKPQVDTDWWECGIEVGIAALKAGVTNILSVNGGLCGPDDDPLVGLGLTDVGRPHAFGHLDQTKDERWITGRHYYMKLLVRMIQALEAEPEGDGTMMDNTVIVYSSDHGETQHAMGDRWPLMLIGNLGSTLRTGRYLQLPGWSLRNRETRPQQGRTLNALWATLLHAAGDPVDHFNLTGPYAELDRKGPIEELLA